MKKWFIGALVLAVVALVCAPVALAGNGHQQHGGQALGHAKFMAKGTVTAVDAEAGTLTMLVWRGNRRVHPYLGTELTMMVAPDARIREVTPDGCVTITLADVTVGDRVMAKGRVDRTDPTAPVFTARWLRVMTPAPPPDPYVEE